ncbi:CPBP family intramembrane metalloprotease [Chryseobacterium sp. MEBOG06]|uniref:CPBP family intramembrane glutamic endopeptidase n=1 Tax=unclassified Chryseobacterium TaxID=2593645 RepID=UPI001F4568D5|nr:MULTISPECIES: type II CAAX endopeptidase family protein [unclassified Chryseobacterium]UKB81950.1 CPBP family intramembrane metalloprotease [Chryseobacterium sp. MEBOG06]
MGNMASNGKYSVGILLTFVLLAAAMLYIFPVINMITGIKGITAVSFFLTRIAIWIILLITFLYTYCIEKGSFLLKEEKKYPIAFYIKAIIGLYFICLIGGGCINVVLHLLIQENMSDKLSQLSSIFKNNYFLIIFTCFTAGAVEEFLMRGYIQPRIEKIYNSPLLGVLVSAILFGILHSTYGTIGQVIVPFFIGIVFALFYKAYSNIKILIICHFMIDFVSLMMMNFIDIKHLSVF